MSMDITVHTIKAMKIKVTTIMMNTWKLKVMMNNFMNQATTTSKQDKQNAQFVKWKRTMKLGSVHW